MSKTVHFKINIQMFQHFHNMIIEMDLINITHQVAFGSTKAVISPAMNYE